MENQLHSNWDTKRFKIADSVPAELDDLQEIYRACSYIGEWCGSDSEVKGSEMSDELEHKQIPLNGREELHRVQTIRRKTDNKVVGYLILYHGFPNDMTFWIATLAIHPDEQGKKYGQEVIESLTEKVTNLRFYENIGGSVSIKNWPALRFWIQSGFNSILKFDGDKEYSKDSFADLWLVKKLQE